MVLEVNGLWKIIGIVSAAVAKTVEIDDQDHKICDLDHYLVFTDVAKFHEWIRRIELDIN
jgi:hypothetical protein